MNPQSAPEPPRKPGIVPLILFGLATIGIVVLAFFILLAAAAAAILLIGGVLACLAVGRTFGRLVTADELARRNGITPRDMDRILEEQQVRSNFYVNGRALYDPRKVKIPEKLLRASQGPIIDAELVRPVESVEQTDGRLLQPAEPANTGRVIDVLETSPTGDISAPD